jgi:hypothetical protein
MELPSRYTSFEFPRFDPRKAGFFFSIRALRRSDRRFFAYQPNLSGARRGPFERFRARRPKDAPRRDRATLQSFHIRAIARLGE